MDILIKSVNSFSFNNITEFCKEGHIEGIQLDYKKDFSKVEILESFFLSSIAVKKHHGKKCRST